jgi:hypothetical protein
MPVYFENSGPVFQASTQTITTGGTAQQVFSAASRNYLLVQNLSDTDMWLGLGFNPSVGNGIKLVANGGGFVAEGGFIPAGSVNILCATAGKAFSAIRG